MNVVPFIILYPSSTGERGLPFSIYSSMKKLFNRSCQLIKTLCRVYGPQQT